MHRGAYDWKVVQFCGALHGRHRHRVWCQKKNPARCSWLPFFQQNPAGAVVVISLPPVPHGRGDSGV